jgi:hypothetical protein
LFATAFGRLSGKSRFFAFSLLPEFNHSLSLLKQLLGGREGDWRSHLEFSNAVLSLSFLVEGQRSLISDKTEKTQRGRERARARMTVDRE